MWSWFRNWRRRRLLHRTRLPESVWRSAQAAFPLLQRLSASQQQRLRDLAVLFLHEKSIEGARGFRLSDEMRLLLAMQACLPILGLDLDWYAGWVSVIVYPDRFVPERQDTDEAGVVHANRRVLSGEAWLHGPVILSWSDIAGTRRLDGDNVVIHEFAHKLDMRNGAVNGMPPLHRDMSPAEWSRAFSAAYADFERRVQQGDELYGINPYAAESPAEFFAVLSEAFFEIAQALRALYPEVYRQMSLFYRQDPAAAV